MSLPTYYIGIDAEALGANINQHAITQIGISIVTVETQEVIFKRSYYIRSQPYVIFDMEQFVAMQQEMQVAPLSITYGAFREALMGSVFLSKILDFIHTNTYCKGIEDRCYNEFWLKHEDRLKETMLKINDKQNSYTEIEVMHEVVTDIRNVIKNDTAQFVTDNGPFDGSIFNTLFHPRPDSFDPLSLTMFFVENGKLTYKPVEDADAFCEGVAWNTPKIPGESIYATACRALKIKLPEWNVVHDHNPENDASVIALNFAFIKHHISTLHMEFF